MKPFQPWFSPIFLEQPGAQWEMTGYVQWQQGLFQILCYKMANITVVE